jgi:hypothetical protein
MTVSQETEPAPSRGEASGARARNVEGTDLHDLFKILGRIVAACLCDGSPAAAPEGLERWEDEDYVYFGGRLPDAGQDFDINIHGDQFMGRLEKRLEPSGPEADRRGRRGDSRNGHSGALDGSSA